MGVPKFYRWLSERYPCLSETVKEFQIPEFDNLYLDMNGIIHICSHPEDDNPHFRITEEKIFSDIFHYIEFLFRMIKPKKVFYMAVDGVAPRAKMNQQRGRRFRSAREAEELVKKAQEKGEVLPTEKRFDSNCITPGTEFMVRLQDQLKYFCVQKISTDPLWQGPRIFISGHETPGEGEHKVMDFIRYERTQHGYDPNTRHCLYGLDADLMILGLASHEPHFSLLREEVRFGSKRDRNKRPATPEETTFHLLHLSLLREYLDYEFAVLRDRLPFPYDLEKIIDDWIMMGFLVGNDFIPHLPNLHINHDALPMLWRTYEQVLPTLDGYLNEGGHLNLKRFEKYLGVLAKFDIDRFSEQFSDMKWLESKVGKKGINEAAAKAAQEERERKERKKSVNDANPFAALVDLSEESDPSKDFSDSGAETFTDPTEETTLSDLSDDDDIFDAEFRQHKRNYYMDKLDYQNVTPGVLQEQARGYVRAIQWILLYYYEGVPSWSWYYPHHYAPYISDLKDFSDMKIEFELGEAFLPFQQLMAVLPAASKELLPEVFRDLMTNESSPVIDFYPVNFKTDLNGKQQDWEAVVLIPFINENRLLEAMDPKYEKMTKSEKGRNSHGPSTMFIYSEERQEPYLSLLPDVFPDINVNHARKEEIPKFKYHIDGNKLKKGLLPSVRLEVYFPGFPTLYHIKHTAGLKKEGVKVFQMNSRGENMVLTISQGQQISIEEAAKLYLGECVYVGWPHMFEAKVVEVCDGEISYKLREHKAEKGRKTTFEKIESKISRDESAVWRREAGSIKEKYHDRLGVIVGHTEILLYALPMTARKYVCGSHGKITLEKQFCVHPVPYALQTIVKDIAIHDPDFQQYRTLDELFPSSTRVFMIGNPHYGSEGEVLDIEDGRVRVNFSVPAEPEMNSIKFRQDSLQTKYMPGYILAQRLGISGLFLSRITGIVFVLQGHKENPRANRINIGLNLKHTKKNQELPGYTKKINDHWMYSEATYMLVRDYLRKFHDALSAVAEAGDMLSEDDLFPADSEYKLRHIQDYIKSLPCNNIKPLSVGADILEEGIVKAIEEEVDKINEENKKKLKKVKMQVKPHLLFRPLMNQGPLVPDQTATYQLYDRVVTVKLGYPVPNGLRGTVVGIHPDEKETDTLYDVVFDQEFIGGICVRCSAHRGYRVPAAALVNITHGERKDQLKLNNQQNPQGFRPSYGTWGQGSGGQASQKQSYTNLMHGKSGKQSPHMNWGSAERRPQKNEDQQKQPYNHFNGRENFNKSLGQKSDSFPNSFDGSPQFVTPKVTQTQISKRTPSRNQSQSAKSMPSQDQTSNSEFANMWKELQAGVANPTAPPSEKPFQEPSLQQAALALGQITPPVARSKMAAPGVEPAKTPTKIDLQTLFDKASQQKETVEKDEFIAMMDSLELSGNKVEKSQSDTNNSNASVENAEDKSLAIRNMLKIGGDEKSPTESSTTSAVPSSKMYGKQVSIQELFDGAKQQEKSPPQEKQPQVQNKAQEPNVHQGQGQQKPGHHGNIGHESRSSRPPPEVGLKTGHHMGNPVLELEAHCQRMGVGPPGYDFKRLQGRYTSMLLLPNGARFEGSECPSREEAAESAASIALLHLQALDRQQHPPFVNIPPARMMIPPPGPPQHLSSPNSAFSPVRPGFVPRGGYSQLRHPRHQFPGPQIPRQHFPGPHQRSGQHYPANQNAGAGGHHHYPANQNVGAGFWNHHHSNQFDMGQGGGGQFAELSKTSGSVKDPAFIPLQVARNQKTPQKRRDHDHVDSQPQFARSENESHNHSQAKQTDSQRTPTTNHASHRSEHLNKTPKSESKPSGNQSGKKRRPRIAANLNFN